ncbi:hypothetical protein [Parasediminibacterium sp. JCM 36343]|uniref:hypothetical protein n=1 Tax=Parasediminibacterium sp. JCM 36343 TaxID=3374279 RepID=UPI00397A3B4A
MQENKNLLWKYAGLATQLFAGLGLMVFVGLWIDKHYIQSFPLLVWLLPFLFLVVVIIKIVKDTSK